MSLTQVVHEKSGSIQQRLLKNNLAVDSSQSHQNPANSATPISATSGGESPPGLYPSGAPHNKHFTTTYGMVLWPTLPGMSSAPSGVSTRRIPGVPPTVASLSTTQALQPNAMAMAMAEPPSDYRKPVFAAGNTMLLRAACDACHRMKRKCDGKNPCTRCDRRGRECFYSCKQKSGPPKGSKRKLVEAEDDLPENRCIKPSLGDFCWPGTNGKSGSDEMQSPTEALASQSSLAVGPSPEARAAAAAAVAASRLNALSPAVPPALAAAGLRSSYMLRSPPILPGLSGGTVPTATPLVTHPRYGTVYQHQYPPEVYAVYLAELRQRSCNIILNSSNSTTTSNGSINENTIHEDGTTSDATAMTTISNASDSCQQEGVDKFEGSPSTRATLLGRLEDGRPPSDAEAASISAVGFENGITSAREFMAQYSGRAELATTGSELLSEAVHFVEHLAGVGASDREIAASGDMLLDRNAFPYVARISEGDNGVGEPAKEAAVSAAASAALAAAVAAAIAEACPGGEDEAEEEYPSKSNVLSKVGRSSTENGWFGVDLAASISPVKGSRFDALPETGLAMVPKYQTAESTMTTPAKKWSDGETSSASSNCEGTTQRERQAAAALLLHGANNRTAMLATANFSDVSGRERMPETCDEHERVKQEKTEDFSQRDDPKAATKFHNEMHSRDDILAA